MKTSIYNAIITEEDGTFVALNPDYDIASQGETIEAALANLREALELYFEETKDSRPNHKIRPAFLTTFSL